MQTLCDLDLPYENFFNFLHGVTNDNGDQGLIDDKRAGLTEIATIDHDTQLPLLTNNKGETAKWRSKCTCGPSVSYSGTTHME